eukprot:EC097419.1.p1 GENE.EC097419.1~~EC097419.1.p1  ORF type:complete len:104 (-),score=8.71 EC097419.1:181-492(-)
MQSIKGTMQKYYTMQGSCDVVKASFKQQIRQKLHFTISFCNLSSYSKLVNLITFKHHQTTISMVLQWILQINLQNFNATFAEINNIGKYRTISPLKFLNNQKS